MAEINITDLYDPSMWTPEEWSYIYEQVSFIVNKKYYIGEDPEEDYYPVYEYHNNIRLTYTEKECRMLSSCCGNYVNKDIYIGNGKWLWLGFNYGH